MYRGLAIAGLSAEQERVVRWSTGLARNVAVFSGVWFLYREMVG